MFVFSILQYPNTLVFHIITLSRYPAALWLMVMACGCHWVLQTRAWARDGASGGPTTRLRAGAGAGDTLTLAQLVLNLRPGNAEHGACHATLLLLDLKP